MLREAMHNPARATHLITENKFFQVPPQQDDVESVAVATEMSSTLSQFERRLKQEEESEMEKS